MLLKFSLVSSCLLAASVLAHPYTQLDTRDFNANSSRWAGLEVLGEASGIFTGVNTSFVVPTSVNGSMSPFSIQAGLDGVHCPGVSLYAGVEVTPHENGQLSYRAWYWWNPDIKKQYLDLGISAGDKIQVSITSLEPGKGTVVITNLNTGGKSQVPLKSLNNPICGRDVIFVVEPQDPHIPIANFGMIAFTNFYDSYGNTNKTSKANEVQLYQNGKVTAGTELILGDIFVYYVA